ncbi:MAG: hypothetical protein ACRDX8_15190, partial [Acidimicrobiales bacterium]
MDLRPEEPWVPQGFSVWITKKRTADWGIDRTTGERRRREVDCWDVGGRADGVQWLKRFRRAGLAQTWKEQLEADFAAGLAFDIGAKRFVTPEPPPAPAVPTVFDLTEAYYRQHPDWEPKTKVLAAMSFNRARRSFLAPGALLEGTALEAVDDYLDRASFLPGHLEGQLTERQADGRARLQAASAPADSLTTAQVESFVARFEVNQRNPERRVAATTITRFLQPLKACWAWAVSRDDIPIDRNPWGAVRLRRKVKGKSTLSTGRLGVNGQVELPSGGQLKLPTPQGRSGLLGRGDTSF